MPNASGGGAGNGVTGRLAMAADEYSCQIWAGQVPPCTRIRVVGGTIDTCRSGKPTHTDVTRSGV